MRTVIIHSSDLHVDVQFSFNWQLTAAIMTLTIREIGRCWKEVGEQSRGPVSLGINLATGSTNRLSPPISRQRTDSYLYCQVAAAAAPQKREDSSKKLRRIGTPVKQNAMQQDTFGCLETSEAWCIHRSATTLQLMTGEVIVSLQPNVLLGNLGSDIHVDATLTHTTSPNTVADQEHPHMVTAHADHSSRTMHPATPRKTFKKLKVGIWLPNSPDLNQVEHLLDVPEQVQFMEASPRNPQISKDRLQTPRCQTQQDTPRGPVFVPHWVGKSLIHSGATMDQTWSNHSRAYQSHWDTLSPLSGSSDHSWAVFALLSCHKGV